MSSKLDDCFSIRKRRFQRIRLSIHPRTEFRKVLDILHCITFPAFIADAENAKFAVLELLNNSLRAHREKKVDKRIQLLLAVEGNPSRLEVTIRDFGGGFDPAKLPYRLGEDVARIDQNSRAFQEYRQANNFQRFGLGLLVVRRVFPYFSFSFFSPEGRIVRWGEEAVAGTLIKLAKGGIPDGRG